MAIRSIPVQPSESMVSSFDWSPAPRSDRNGAARRPNRCRRASRLNTSLTLRRTYPPSIASRAGAIRLAVSAPWSHRVRARHRTPTSTAASATTGSPLLSIGPVRTEKV